MGVNVMKAAQRLATAFLMVMILATGARAGKRSGKPALLVIPVRYTVVQFAFDIAKLRPTELLAYDKGMGDEPLALHRWNAGRGDWDPASLEAYSAGELFAATPAQAFLVGSDSDMPGELVEGAAWCPKVTRIESLHVVDLANTISAKLDLSSGEWKWLAKRHRLELQDLNVEQRKYGRYGKPGAKPPEARARKRPNLFAQLFRRSWDEPDPEAGEPVEPGETELGMDPEPDWEPVEKPAEVPQDEAGEPPAETALPVTVVTDAVRTPAEAEPEPVDADPADK